MAYQIKKDNEVVEELEFLDNNNEVVKKINVKINIDKIASEYRQRKLEITEAQQKINKGEEDAVELFGVAIINMFKTVFGEENTVTILEYFEGKYTDMLTNCIPFIEQVIQPAIEKVVRDKKQLLANNMNLNRKQKKSLGL